MQKLKEIALRTFLKLLNFNSSSIRFTVEPRNAQDPVTTRVDSPVSNVINVAERDFFMDGLFTVHGHEWIKNKSFRQSYQRAIKATGRDYEIPWRTHVAIWAARSALSVEGDFIELGTGRGWMMSAILDSLDWTNNQRKAYLFDRFLPNDVDRVSGQIMTEINSKSVYADAVTEVENNFTEWSRVEIVQGELPESLHKAHSDKIAFLHIDLNAAIPETQSLRDLWDRITPGGLILLDDYNYAGYEAQHDAMDNLSVELGFHVLSLPTGQGLIIKGKNEHIGA